MKVCHGNILVNGLFICMHLLTVHMSFVLLTDELAGFDETWNGKARQHLPGWNQGYDMLGSSNTSKYLTQKKIRKKMLFFECSDCCFFW